MIVYQALTPPIHKKGVSMGQPAGNDSWGAQLVLLVYAYISISLYIIYIYIIFIIY